MLRCVPRLVHFQNCNSEGQHVYSIARITSHPPPTLPPSLGSPLGCRSRCCLSAAAQQLLTPIAVVPLELPLGRVQLLPSDGQAPLQEHEEALAIRGLTCRCRRCRRRAATAAARGDLAALQQGARLQQRGGLLNGLHLALQYISRKARSSRRYRSASVARRASLVQLRTMVMSSATVADCGASAPVHSTSQR